jgi:filamentous hemagglutinin family protein
MTSIIPAGRRSIGVSSWQRLLVPALAAFAVLGWDAAAHAQPAGATVVHGQAIIQPPLGNSLLVTTVNGAGTKYSAIDWRTFSVPAGSVTRFQQPSADSTSINRVTGGKLSDIQGTLSSNGNLVLVNPAGIALGKNALVDTAGFTASTLEMSDADALAGRLRFSASAKDDKQIKIEGRILARGGDIVLIGTDVQVGTLANDGKDGKDDKGGNGNDNSRKDDKVPAAVQQATLQADNGSVIIAAGQQVQITGRGLEGIVMQLAPKGKIEITKDGLIHADAVGLFASELTHSGAIQARRVVIQDNKVRLDSGDDDNKSDSPGKGNSGNGNGNANGNSGNGNGNSGNGNVNSGSGNSGNGNGNSGNGNSATTPASGTVSASITSELDGGGGTVVIAPLASAASTTAAPTSASTDPALQPSLQAALAAPSAETIARSATVIATYLAPAVTPGQSLADDGGQDRYAAAPEKRQDKGQDVAQCTR